LVFPRPSRLAILDSEVASQSVCHQAERVAVVSSRHLDDQARHAIPNRYETCCPTGAARVIGMVVASASRDRPFSAELILIRGALVPDVFPTTDVRLHATMRAAYELPTSSGLEPLQQLAEPWRPFRSWVASLFRTARDEDTHEIRGRVSGAGR